MYEEMQTKIIDLTPYLRQTPSFRRRERAYTVLALWTQYLSLGALVLYGLLRLLLCPEIPLGAYIGPLAALWPVSYLLLLVSYGTDKLMGETGIHTFS